MNQSAHLAGFGMFQIPELHMSVPHCDEVAAVLREGHTRHLTGHLVSSHHHVLLQEKVHNQKVLQKENYNFSLQKRGGVIRRYLPGPHTDNHVVLVSHTDDVFAVGGERHTRDAVFVPLELRHLTSLRNVPHSDCWEVAALRDSTGI